ncbi:hypothetical protein AEAC466_11325 [Asticcacaulis sp. AC466]|uniref:hypothetical protein n=1 Tax=Asticcacaulis sp. AC466 TaxID=1282362 RepID=UPI0003C40747|nr:hypothetical protein [Asticcacaulis sp. AC466]ESQ83912.1 hypothetical protein AEAC466_11325 [Asticcacaulis sp. AC466]
MSALALFAQALRAKSAIAAEDVLALRQLVWGNDATISTDEANAIMALNSACHVRSKEWIDYFVEVMVDYVVKQQAPVDYVDDAKADWLMGWINRDGRVDSLGELELLIKIIEVAAAVPEALRSYVLLQIELAVLTGDGPTRTQRNDGDGHLDPRYVNDTEVGLLRRAVFAVAGDGAYIVSQAEAEMLFRIKDATIGAKNAPGWADLFVKAVGNHLMGHASYQPLTNHQQRELDAYVADTSLSMARFAKRAFGRRTTDPRAGAVIENDRRARVTDAQITPNEKSWLTARIQADGARDPLETELLNFIRRERAGV